MLLQKVSEKLLTDSFYLPIHCFVMKKKNLCFFSYLKFKFNKALYEKDKITNLYRQQNI